MSSLSLEEKLAAANLVPQARVYLELMNQQPSIVNLEPHVIREALQSIPKPQFELPALKSIEDKKINVKGNEQITVRIYTPEGEGPFPLVVYYHGGGWVIGDLETANESCHLLAHNAQVIVVSVDYRLSPEYKFPTPFNDSYTALQWVAENAVELNGSVSKMFVAGDSAGGNLSAAVSLRSKQENGPAIAGQILIYPVTALDYNTESYQLFENGFGLDKDLMIWFGNHYIRNEEDTKAPYIAPLYANDLTGLPPAFVIAVENDVLRDEGQAYAKKLENAGIKVEERLEEGLVHGYFTNYAMFGENIENTITAINRFIKSKI